jgi:hypothetical protein
MLRSCGQSLQPHFCGDYWLRDDCNCTTSNPYNTRDDVSKRTVASVPAKLALCVPLVGPGARVHDGSLLDDQAVLHKLLDVLPCKGDKKLEEKKREKYEARFTVVQKAFVLQLAKAYSCAG